MLRSTTECTCCRDLQCFPSPHGRLTFCSVVCRAAVLQSWKAQWPSHRAPSVGTQLAECAPMLKSSHRRMGDGKMADALASTLACTTAADALVNYRLYVQQRLKTSHRPHGRLKFGSLFAGRRCLCRFWHGHNNVFHDLRESSFLCE
jgi:hypothetical protein